MTEQQRIADFWRWWADNSSRIDDAIEAGEAGELGSEVSAQVGALHPDLQWELTPGNRAKHALCVSSGGVPELRPLAERVVRAAPPTDDTWEYHPARIPDHSVLKGEFEFQLGPHALDLSETRIGIEIDDDRQLIDVRVHHPAFDEMPDEARRQVTFLVLDWLLGEDGVERWIGGVEWVVEAPPDGLEPDALAETVEKLAERSGEAGWVLLEWEEEDGTPAIATARRPLKWIDYPLFDQHIAIALPYSERNPAGFPDSEALTWLREAEEAVLAELGDVALLAAHETSDGVRTFHLYADSDDPTASERVAAWATKIPDVSVEISLDPGWQAVRHFA